MLDLDGGLGAGQGGGGGGGGLGLGLADADGGALLLQLLGELGHDLRGRARHGLGGGQAGRRHLHTGRGGAWRDEGREEGVVVLCAWLRVKAGAYYYDSVIRNPTPSLRRSLEPSQFCVGMSDTQRNSPPDWDIFPAQSGNPSCSELQFTARSILYVDY